MIEAEPDAPAMVIEGHWKQQRRDEEDCQDELVMRANEQQRDKIQSQNHDLGRDDVDQDRSDKEAFLTHKERVARRAMVFDLEWALDD